MRYSVQYLLSVGAVTIEGIRNARGTVRFLNTLKNCPATAIVRWDDGHINTVLVTDLVREDRVQLEAALPARGEPPRVRVRELFHTLGRSRASPI